MLGTIFNCTGLLITLQNNKHLKVIYHPLYGMNNYVLIWDDWLSYDPLRGSHDKPITPYKETLVPHLMAAFIYLTQIYSYYIRGDRSPLKNTLLKIMEHIYIIFTYYIIFFTCQLDWTKYAYIVKYIKYI